MTPTTRTLADVLNAMHTRIYLDDMSGEIGGDTVVRLANALPALRVYVEAAKEVRDHVPDYAMCSKDFDAAEQSLLAALTGEGE